MSKQTLIVSKMEVVILEALLIGILLKLENDYNKNKNEKGFLKTDALNEIALLKELKAKVDLLDI